MGQQEKIQAAVRAILEAIGEDPEREGLQRTPLRVAEMYRELFSGLGQDPREILATGFEEGYQGTVVVKDIPFYSVCEHHLLPFSGVAQVGYIPRGRIVGASKLVRALEVVARRPQLQERLTGQLADAVFEALGPDGVAVVVAAEHLCMSMRGVKKPGSRIVTTATRGDFSATGVSKGELLMQLLGGGQ
ncbi:MAG: GTP cyclohydrolase I FolE [Chloroflexi bacterium]|nr:GTP cyclohydrolase I FolE [Chloroflexota bacterium]